MSDLRATLRHIIGELKRRRVFRFTIMYVIVAFVVLEGAGNLFSALNLPEWTVTFVAAVVILGFPVAIFLAWVFDINIREGVVRTAPLAPAGEAVQQQASVGKPISQPSDGRKSIAVLPFADMSPERDQEYFSDGIAEEIINALTKVEDLRVAARTSAFAVKGKGYDAHEIGEKLKVSNLLEGSVRKAGTKLRITAQLIDVADGYHLWSEQYDRELEDVFAIQDEIAHSIVDALKVKLMGGEDALIVKPGTDDVEAYTLYLKGRYFWNKRTGEGFAQGIEHFERAIEVDEEYAPAYAGLADTYSLLGWYQLSSQEAYEKTVSAAEKALELDDSLAEAYTSSAYAKFLYGWDWAGAEVDFKRAIERNPDYPTARQWYAEFLMAMGRFDEALDQVRRAQVLDPLSLSISIGVGWALYFKGLYDESIEQYRNTLERDPSFVHTPWFLGPAYIQKGMYEEAIALYEDWISRSAGQVGLEALLAHAYAVSGRREQTLDALSKLKESARRHHIAPDYVALVLTGLGEIDQAFEWLEKAFDQRSWYLVYLKFDPAYEGLRSDPRFLTLLKKIGLSGGPTHVSRQEQPGESSDRQPRHPWAWYSAVAAGILLVIGALLWQAWQGQQRLIESATLQQAALYSQTLTEMRTLYTSEVVARVRSHGVEVTHDYAEREGAIPLPATLSMMLGEKITERGGGGYVRLYSDFPFPWRTDGGPKDDFQLEALIRLRQDPTEPVYRFDTIDDRPVMRYATADLMRPSCVGCHNTHPESPKTNWQVGDLRGVLEVTIPLDAARAHATASFRGTFILLLTIGSVAFAILILMGRNLREQLRLD